MVLVINSLIDFHLTEYMFPEMIDLCVGESAVPSPRGYLLNEKQSQIKDNLQKHVLRSTQVRLQHNVHFRTVTGFGAKEAAFKYSRAILLKPTSQQDLLLVRQQYRAKHSKEKNDQDIQNVGTVGKDKDICDLFYAGLRLGRCHSKLSPMLILWTNRGFPLAIGN